MVEGIRINLGEGLSLAQDEYGELWFYVTRTERLHLDARWTVYSGSVATGDITISPSIRYGELHGFITDGKWGWREEALDATHR